MTKTKAACLNSKTKTISLEAKTKNKTLKHCEPNGENTAIVRRIRLHLKLGIYV